MDAMSLFSTRVRQMILRYKALEAENRRLRDELAGKDALVGRLNEQLRSARHDYENLMTARMVQISDGDMEAAQKRLARLIREVNRCITLISEN